MTATPVYPVPTSLSPSRVSGFTTCPLQFRFTSIERLPDPPSIHTTKGTLVHRTLELLFALPAEQRTLDAAMDAHATTRSEYTDHPDVTGLELDEEAVEQMWADTVELVVRYFEMETPSRITPEGLELNLEASMGEFTLRGIIDRLERDDDGSLVISDYKTGKSPPENLADTRMNSMMLYAWLCLQHFGSIPKALRLMYLRDGVVHTKVPDQRGVEFHVKRTVAVWKAIAGACTSGDFRPKRSALCGSCSYQRWCPEFGGDPALAATEAPLVLKGKKR